MSGIESINAITLRTTVMAASVQFYEALGFQLSYGGTDASFSTLRSGGCFVNLIAVTDPAGVETGWGRVIFHVGDVDALYRRALGAGLRPQAEPLDAPWGERMFAIFDPAGHDLSFAKRIRAYEADHPKL
ncbi:VOC family protein [Candidatus Poriferisodalis sp.]|uniref:VOC family protein n=1 Tax=Candidatus Poriferisodalis sp. TaxID=3101277 RepID=UPI003B01DCD8